jgi:catechol 2,3-dioxygenase
LPSRRDLALALKRLREAGIRLQGSADHSVSQSLYLADPDGNGIELYCDRPRQQWTHEDGQLKMTVDPLDTTALLSEAAGESIPSLLPPGSSVGHVHLRVSYIDPSERFYCHTLGFELTARYGQAASFVAAGGYHHHIAFNVWHGVGVPAPPEGALGLRRFSIVLPSKQALEQLAQRLRDAGITFQKVDGSILLKDPSGIPLALTV